MKLRLLAFASASEAIGATELDYTLQPTDRLPAEDDNARPRATVGDLKADLTAKYPRVSTLWERLAVSVDGTIVSDAEQLHDGAEVALLPPVSGG